MAMAGLDVEVLEANATPGGCIWTEQLDTGHRLELGAIDLSMVDGVVADLRLADHGLRLLGREVLVGAGFGDGTELLFHSDLDTTVAGMATVAAVDREAYRNLASFAGKALGAFDAIPGVPTFGEVVRLSELMSSHVDLARLLVSSAESVVARRISDSHLASTIEMFGAHGQLPPWLPGTGLFALLLPGTHGNVVYRPQGGTVALVESIVAAIEAAGGSVRTGARVVSIERSGETTGIGLEGGDVVVARRVVSSLDVRRTVGLLAEPDEELRAAAASVRSGALNVAELKVDLALSVPATVVGGDGDAALWMLQERPDSLHTSFGEIIAGTLPTSTAMMWAAPSALDPSAAPDGGGTVWLSAFVPARLRDRAWDRLAEEEATERVLDGFARIVGTDLRPLTVDRRITGPKGWEERIGSPLGHPNHIDMTLDQLFGWRPPGVDGYRTGLSWLYLTGAGTFPGGGVSGVPGRNTAMALLSDLGSGPRRAHRFRREIRGLREGWGLFRSLRKRT